MYPFIKEGDRCTFQDVDKTLYKRGDVLLFESSEGVLTGHRFVKSQKRDDLLWIICKGDTNLFPDSPFPEHKIIGKLIRIKKTNKTIDMNQPLIKIYNLFFTNIRLLSILVHLYVYKILKKRNEGVNEHTRSY
ncbi:hypothetical protein LCL95_01535 [Bacillus timonensis]|nr:hypothetical protein [Bacillus timonensis]